MFDGKCRGHSRGGGTASNRLGLFCQKVQLLGLPCFLFTFLFVSAFFIANSTSTAHPRLSFETTHTDDVLPRYTARSYPNYPSSFLLSSLVSPAHHRTRRHHGSRHGHLRHRRQFTFGSANISLGYGSLSEAESGPWGPWSELSECTRSCGIGVQYQTRVCMDRFTPNSCVGPSKRYFSCKYEECPPGSADFREDQCTRFNSIPFEGQYFEWTPYHKGRNPCELNCMPKGQRFYVRHARKVIDGTRCFVNETTNICVDGVCVELGCDRILGSGTREDKCRVCGGDGSTCRTVEGVYDQTNGMQSGYNDILLIPSGATNIEIREARATNNYLAVRNLAGTYYLNGDWHIQQPSTFNFAGTKWEYSKPQIRGQQRDNQPESLIALGPTSEALFVVLLYQEANQGIAYEYSVPFSIHQPALAGVSTGQAVDVRPSPQLSSSTIKYSWIFGDYSSCTKSCGTGIQRRDVFCASVNPVTGRQEQVQKALCDPSVRPADSRPCTNEKPCPATWYTGQWSVCSCVHNMQHRSVFCTSGEIDPNTPESSCPILEDGKCNDVGTRPEALKPCVPERCPVWIEGQWSECDSRCGEGLHNRTVKCGFPAKKQSVSTSVTTEKLVEAPKTEEELLVAIVKRETDGGATELPTLAPTTTDASLVTVVAFGVEVETKETEIISEEDEIVDEWQCDPETRPKEVDKCFRLPCDETGSVEWITSAWSSCDTDCGSQISTRKVLCSTRDGTVFSDDICQKLHGEKPLDTQACPEKAICSKSLWFTSEWSECNVKCGTGMKTRHVFCGHVDEGKVLLDEDESKCVAELKPLDATVCKGPDCLGLWLVGPLGPCTVPCGGGQRKRPLFCMHECSKTGDISPVSAEVCSSESSFTKSEQCNVESCDEDQIATLLTCKDTANGCCPTDLFTPAEEDYLNCPVVLASNETTVVVRNCKESTFGCCYGGPELEVEGDFEAMGPFRLGCPVRCGNTKYGCCDDDLTVTNSTDKSDCPVEAFLTTTTIAPTTTTLASLANLVNIVEAQGPISNCSNEVEGSGDSDCTSSTINPGMIDCKLTKFGCCADGWTEAEGPNAEGCDEDGSGNGGNVFTSTISSFLTDFYNTVTGATDASVERTTTRVWPESEDCNLSEFGCCPNGKKKAIGPNYYGCTCEDYPYGCCQDHFYPATGENFEGCVCDRMMFGCCADQVTPATGPNQEGCNCESSTYGCCSDMVTTARGPNFQGCPCDSLTFGCCPGSTIPAKGPNFEGCTCADTPFGCCADGITVAYGPRFEGCPSGPLLDLKLASEVCGLPMQVGSCRNFSVKWYFDVSYGSCNRFWYGGCEGNGNRFSSQELCERACVKPEGPERCTLPKISGPCNASQVVWYYDSPSRRCDRFGYGGCLGNTNRFESEEQCEEHCVNQEKVLDACEQPMSAGPCRGNYRRWYFRKEEGRCRDFLYGGCQGNLNNFNSEVECSNACAQQSPFEICSAPKAAGPCLGNFPRWHFDKSTGHCREFTYTGCEGNKNRFVDRESCERLCNQTITYGYETERRPGQQYPTAHQPEPDDVNSVYPTRYDNVCALPKSEGPCRDMIIQWHYNSTARRCDRFYYGGCGGNGNRFNDREACEAQCVAVSNTPIYTDPCLEPKEPGQCTDYSERWYYDAEDRRCHRFYFSGCGGNRNNYQSLEECSARCERPREPPVSSTTETTISVGHFHSEFCFKAFDSGPCQHNQIRWYYDRRDGGCKEFIYGGCGGNENRFESQQQCETNCWNSQDICKLSPSRGSCSLNFTQWYFDYGNKECYEFQFSGCHGNANRFSSKEECDAQCKFGKGIAYPGLPPAPQPAPFPVPEQCRLFRDPGPCRGYFSRWFFSVEENQCQHFIFGGCEGNENRFNNLDECESTCTSRSLEDDAPQQNDVRDVVCRLPAESGPCPHTQARWFYDSDSHTCLPFAYGGCKGNKNRFRSYEQCIGFCGGVQSRDLIPPRAPQPEIPPYQQPTYQQPSPTQPQPQPPPPQPPVQPPTQPEDCEPVSCNEEQCLLGIDYYTDPRGCPSCRCTNPCYDLHCPDDMSCALELYRDDTGKARGHAECRLRQKPGHCPSADEVLAASPAGPNANETNCIVQCRTDSDCRGADKCCNNGCANVCFSIFGAPEIPAYPQQPRQPQPPPQPQPQPRPEPEPESFPYDPNSRPDIDDPTDGYDPNAYDPTIEQYDPEQGNSPQGPTGQVSPPNESSIPEVSVMVDAGRDALLDCHIMPEQTAETSAPTVTWSREGRQLILEASKFEQFNNGSLVVKQTTFNDHGTYACVMTGASGQETGYVRLHVKAPARILPGPKKVIAQIGLSSFLQCNAIGYPDPRVTWYRGEKMLPLNSFKYRQMQNFTLLIRKVGNKDSGIYTCNAFNGIGPAALWDVTLLLDSKPQMEPEIVDFSQYNASISSFRNPVASHRPTSYLDRIGAEIKMNPLQYKIGSTLELRCVVRSQINGEVINPTLLSSVSWFVNSDIPLTYDTNPRYRLTDGNSTLVVYNMAKQDSGEYRCRASTGPYADTTASVQIHVDNIFVPPDCQDSSTFVSCDMIIANNYCSNPIYNKFCCRSCYIAAVKAGSIREAVAAA